MPLLHDIFHSITSSSLLGRLSLARPRSCDEFLRRLLTVSSLCFVLSGLSSCCYISGYRTPEHITRWQVVDPPRLSLVEKGAQYQEGIEQFFQTSEGLLQYRRRTDDTDNPSYGNLADGCFHSGMYLASQALRYATTADPGAREQIILTLEGLRLLSEVSGKHGLLARHYSPAGTVTGDPRWLPSPTHPAYEWRSDVSKDQYAGYIHGLGVTAALVEDPEIRATVAELSAAVADHLIENDLRIVDSDGEPTTFGDLDGRFLGMVPIGVNALVTLAIAKVAAVTNDDPRYTSFHADLVASGYADLSYWAHVSLLGFYKRVNDHMGYLALVPLLLLEKDPKIVAALRRGERRSWSHMSHEHNAFFAFVHAALVGEVQDGDDGLQASSVVAPQTVVRHGLEALRQFPENKVQWPIDLTREGFDFSYAWIRGDHCAPKSTRPVPLYLRSRSSNFWGSDPYRLVANLQGDGNVDSSGQDYLLAYWLGRYYQFVSPND